MQNVEIVYLSEHLDCFKHLEKLIQEGRRIISHSVTLYGDKKNGGYYALIVVTEDQ